MRDYWFVIPGINPVPWTSPTVAVGKKNGKAYPQVYSSAELKGYKEAIKEHFQEKYPDFEPIEDEVALRFFLYRRLDSLERGTKRKSRGSVADATNMQKATEDALQGLLFVNDIQVVHAETWVMAQHADVEPCIVVNLIWHPERPELPDNVQAVVDNHPDLFDTDNVHDVTPEDFV
jgi:Holliday junction resolvase RusA-like endonuclease